MRVVDAEAMQTLRLRQALEVADELMTAEMSVTAMSEHLSLKCYRDELRRLAEALGNDEANEPEN